MFNTALKSLFLKEKKGIYQLWLEEVVEAANQEMLEARASVGCMYVKLRDESKDFGNIF